MSASQGREVLFASPRCERDNVQCRCVNRRRVRGRNSPSPVNPRARNGASGIGDNDHGYGYGGGGDDECVQRKRSGRTMYDYELEHSESAA